jgi:hypothetical protein
LGFLIQGLVKIMTDLNAIDENKKTPMTLSELSKLVIALISRSMSPQQIDEQCSCGANEYNKCSQIQNLISRSGLFLQTTRRLPQPNQCKINPWACMPHEPDDGDDRRRIRREQDHSSCENAHDVALITRILIDQSLSHFQWVSKLEEESKAQGIKALVLVIEEHSDWICGKSSQNESQKPYPWPIPQDFEPKDMTGIDLLIAFSQFQVASSTVADQTMRDALAQAAEKIYFAALAAVRSYDPPA